MVSIYPLAKEGPLQSRLVRAAPRKHSNVEEVCPDLDTEAPFSDHLRPRPDKVDSLPRSSPSSARYRPLVASIAHRPDVSQPDIS
jgi:hypothetical protein